MPWIWSMARGRVQRLFRSFQAGLPRILTQRLSLLPLEERVVPAAGIDPALFDSLRTAVADFNGDRIPDLLVTGPGTVRAVNGADGSSLFSVPAFGSYSGPLSIAAADTDRDGKPEIALAAAYNGGPRVKVISGKTQQVIFDQFVYDSRFTGGVSVALGDVTGDGIGDLITAAGFRGGPHIRIFDGATSFATSRSFFAYDDNYRGGVNIAVGDIDGDGVAEIVTGTGPGGGAHVRVFDGRTLKATHAFFSGNTTDLSGTQVGIGDVDGNGLADVVTLSQGRVHAYSGRNPTAFIDIAAGTGRSVNVADLNNDGFGEILVSDTSRVQGYSGDPVAPSGFSYTPDALGGFANAPPTFPASIFNGEAFFVPGNGNGTVRAYRLRAYTTAGNTVGLFPVDDATGRVGTLNPGDAGYLVAALASKQQFFANSGSASNTLTVPGGHFYGFYVVSGGSTLVSFAKANPGGASQFRFLPRNRIAVEERSLPDGSDADFNDAISNIIVNGVTVPPPPVPPVPPVPPSPPVPPPPPTSDGNIPPDLAGITTVITGGTTGTVTPNADNTVTLREGDAFRVALSQPFTVPANGSVVRVTYDSLNFDTASTGTILDAFEVAVLAADGTPLALPTAPERDASFNVSEGLSAITAPGTTSGTETITINLSALPAGTKAQLVMRLVNDDTDNTTSVRIRRIDYYTTSDAAPTGVVPVIQPGGAGAVDFGTLSDVTPSLKAEYGRTTLTDERTLLTTDLSLRNTGTYAITDRVLVGIANLSDPSVNVIAADGVSPDGVPYYDFTNYIIGSLAAGAVSIARTIQFSNPGRERFTFDVVVLAGLNHAPAFTSSPLTLANVGQGYADTAVAADPDGQALTFTLLGGPEGMSIAPDTGLLTWTPVLADVGSHSVRVRVSDTFKASAEQSFTLKVVANLPNRPPVFTSTPGTAAKVAGAFEVTTIKTGADPVGVTAADFGRGQVSVVSANAGDANLTVNSSEGGVFTPAAVSVGEPKPNGLLFRQGTNIDIGLPAFDNGNDRNSLTGFTQGDFNGDGILDLATATHVLQRLDVGGDVYSQLLSISLGDGDGGFLAPLVTTPPIPTEYYSNFNYLFAKDYDSDGKTDLVGVYYSEASLIAEYAPRVLFLKGQGDGTFATAVSSPIGGFRIINPVNADVNNDGKLDIVGTKFAPSASELGILLGNGDGTFGTYTTTFKAATANGLYYGTAFGDLDGKNGVDLVVPNYEEQNLTVLYNDGSGGFGNKTVLAAKSPFASSNNNAPQTTWVADFDGDGKADILYATASSANDLYTGGLGLYSNTGDGTIFTFRDGATGFQQRPYDISNNAQPVDLNADGKLDVILGSSYSTGSTAVSVALNKGDGTFTVQNYEDTLADRAQVGYGWMNSSVLAGDYNRDGLLDLAVGSGDYNGLYNNFSAGSAFSGVSILYADTPGKFAAAYEIRTTNQAFINIVGDVNNDGNPDVLIGDGGRFYTRLGNGDGTFGELFPATQSRYANDPHAAFLVDLDHDGVLDLLWGRMHGYQGANQAYMAALGNGDGTFRITFDLSALGSFYGGTMIAPQDYNQDGYQDFAAYFGSAFAVGTAIDVYLYNPAVPGTFTAAYRYLYTGDTNPFNGSAISNTLQAGDFDGDSIIDLLSVPTRTDGNTHPHRIHFFHGKGDGTFNDPIETPIYQVNVDGRVIVPMTTAVGDINNDGKLDFALEGAYNHLGIFLGNGDGTFQTPIQYVGTRSFNGDGVLNLVDLDGDGNLDTVETWDVYRDRIIIRRGHGDGTFDPQEVYYATGDVSAPTFADIDNDGVLDLVTHANGSRVPFTLILPGTNPGLTAVTNADVNGDGKPDVVAINGVNGHVKLMLSNGDDTFTRQFDLLVGKGAVAVAAFDFNGDTKTDIVTANKAARSVTLLTNTGSGSFTRSDVSVGKLLTAMATGDLTGDALRDVVVASEEAKAVYLLMSTTAGLTAPVAIPTGEAPGQVTIGDATGDGLNDIIVSLPGSKRLMILPGKGDGTFASPLYVQLKSAAGSLGVADFNADGKADIAITLPSDDQAAILFGRGNGLFARPQTITVGDDPASLSITDMNADGRPDILVANRGDATASVIINRYDPTNLYRYTPTATDADGDVVTFDLTNGPGGMIYNAATHEIVWAPTADQIGLNAVTVLARDGQGGTATQSFNIGVEPNRYNASPVIFSAAQEMLKSTDAYSHSPSAIDPNGDTLRYRLLSGPDGATVDPTTGEVTWDPRQGAMKFNNLPSDYGSVITPNSTTLNPASFTVEGWFRIDGASANQLLFHKTYTYNGFQSGNSFRLWYLNGSLHATITAGVLPNGSVRELIFGIAWTPDLGEWHHYALTFDDTTGTLAIFADGKRLAAQTDHGLHIAYDGNPIQIGYEYGNPLRGAASQFRIWNVAKSESQLQADLTRDVVANAPGLVLDFRFDNGDAETVFDHSQFRNNGRRTSQQGAWPAASIGLAPEQTQYFTLQVEDGRGGVSTQSFGVTVVPPIRTAITGTFTAAGSGLAKAIVYLDSNGNGVRDIDEAFARTAANGSFQIAPQLEGRYLVAVEPQAGFDVPAPQSLTVVRGQAATVNLVATPRGLAQIRGTVLIDSNGNGVPHEAQAVYTSVFDAASPDLSMWSFNALSTIPSGAKLLGEFYNQSVTLSLGKVAPLPTHDSLTFTIDLALLRQWYGNYEITAGSPPQIAFEANGVELFRTTFANSTNYTQAYPQALGASNPGRTGAIAINSLGYNADTIQRLTFTVPHSDPTATFTIRGLNMPYNSGYSAFALKGMTVTAAEPAATQWPVYLDANSNNVFDDGEIRTLTDTAGNYAFTGLDANTWHVRLDNPAGWNVTTPVTGQYDVALPKNGTSNGNEFVIKASADAASQPRFITTPQDYATARVVYRFANAAVDPGYRPLTYSLAAGPEGMSIDPATGTVVWTPSLDQVGEQRVILKVVNDRGGMALQDFTIGVRTPNSDPIITSTAPSAAGIDVPFDYDVLAQDAEEPTLTYAFTAAPASAVIDAVTGELTWLPSAVQLGVQQFTVEVTDEQGGVARQSFAITVTPATANTPPVFTGTQRVNSAVKLPYFARLSAADVDGDPLTFALVTGPAGMNVTGDGLLNWTPTAAQFGSNSVTVSVDDGRGGLVTNDFTIDVRSTFANRPPNITSTAANFAVAGKDYRYDIAATDADQDAIAYELVSGPAGLSLDPRRGTVRWNPAADQFGQHSVTVRAMDAFGGVAEQTFTITVRAVGGPPAITSVPTTTAAVGNAYLYSVLASDAENDPLTFTLLQAPAGMVISTVTGEIVWTPTASDLGPQTVIIQVSDGVGGFATQGFAIEVAAGVANQPPTITSNAPLLASAGTVFTYTLTATDPEGTALTYTLRRGPASMTVNPTTGEVTWTPTASDIGTVIVAFAVTDAGGAAAVQSFELQVLPANVAPTILSTFPISVPARGTYKYDAIATDANLDPLSYTLSGAPAGMTVDAFGRIRWATGISDLGVHSFTLRVSDPRGGSVTQSISLNVIPDTTPPRVTVIPLNTIVRSNSPQVFAQFNLTPSYPSNRVRVSAVDNVAVAGIIVTANGKAVSLDAQGYATFNFTDWGFGGITVTAKASDAAGNVGVGVKAFAFLPFGDDPAVSQFAPPSVVITSPTDSTLGVVQIRGSASSDNFTSYTLSVRKSNGISTGNIVAGDFDIPDDYTNVQFTTLATGNSKINDGVLGTWDTTLLENGDYVLRLEEQDDVYGTTVFESNIGVRGEFKLGNFRLSFSDITLPVAGIPITLARTYDTLQSNSNSELGFGWRLEFRDAGFRTNLPKTGLEDVGIYSAFKPGTKVYVTLPGGVREGFTFTPDIRALPGFGGSLLVGTPRFTPDRGVTDTLSAGGGSLIVDPDTGEFSALGGIPWNPANPDFGGGFTLTTRDGIRYHIDGNSGLLTSATDRSGNTLTFTDSGISGSGVSLTFERDAKGRITKAIDPAGNSVRYAYDAKGDLISVTDREGNVTRFTYMATPAHYLDTVIDPLGRTGVRTEYDANGRLIRTFGASGQSSTIAYDPANEVVSALDEAGHPSTYIYDERGNVLTFVDASGATTHRSYDAENNQTSLTNAVGETTRYTYDTVGNVTSVRLASGSVTTYAYSAHGDLISEVDPLGHAILYARDSRGNLTAITDARGQTTTYAYNSAGQSTMVRDPLGHTTTTAYDAAGRPISETDALGHVAAYTYDAVGNRTSESRTRTTVNGPELVLFTTNYNANGDVVSQTDAMGAKSTLVYDAAGLAIAKTDALGRLTTATYSPGGSLLTTTYPDGTVQSFTLDVREEPASATNRAGGITELSVDPMGRLLQSKLAGTNLTKQFTSDGLGRLTAVIDELGRQTQFTFASPGNAATAATNALGQVVSSTYDAAGRQITSTDTAGRVTRFEYDDADNPTATDLPGGGRRLVTYDALNRIVSRTDELGRVTGYEYDARGAIDAVIDPAGARLEYEYDELGALVRERDPLGCVTHYDYDLAGRLTKITLPMGQSSTFTYNLLGELQNATDFDGRTTTFEYDLNGHLTRKILPGGVAVQIGVAANGKTASVSDSAGTATTNYDSRDRITAVTAAGGGTLTYTYDEGNRVTGITTADGTTSYTYDALNRIASVTDADGRITSYVYDAAGNLTSTQFPNGILEVRTYNGRDWLASVQQSNAAGDVVARYDYQRNAAGQLTDVIELSGRRTNYTYDAASRLLGEVVTGPGLTTRTTTCTYDLAGNRTTKIDSLDGSTAYTYDGNGRLVVESQTGKTITYAYDAAGNRILRDGGLDDRTTYEWDADGHLVGATVVNATGTHVLAYGYDLHGNLVSRSVNGVETRYLIDVSTGVSRVLREYAPDGTTLAAYVYGRDRVAQTRGGATSFFLDDGESGPRLLTGVTGLVQGGTTFDAYGQVLVQSGPQTDVAFHGEFRDPFTGLDFLRARRYDPSIGQFISRDAATLPKVDWANNNRYVFAASDPVNRVDPTGQFSLAEALVATQVVGYLAAAIFVTNVFQLLVNKQIYWNGSLATFGAEIGIGFGLSALRVETRDPVLVEGTKNTMRHFNALYDIFEIDFGLDVKLPSLGNDDVLLGSPAIHGAKDTTMQGLFLRAGAGVGLTAFSAGLSLVRIGLGQGFLSSTPSLDLSAGYKQIPGLPVRGDAQFEVGITGGIGFSWSNPDRYSGYHDKAIFPQ
ncbi:hypothetical protein BH11PLA2_BH11PLA2_40530 [soil metagenome]